MNKYLNRVYEDVKARDKNEPEFLQAVNEVFESLSEYVDEHPEIEANAIMERIVEPERSIEFRVTWVDDLGKTHVNRGYRIQFNSAIGPYKGGLRLHPSVNKSIIKFLGFEQIFKNSLTGLSMGGGKGGSDFDPKGKSDAEIMRFCQNFMLELSRHIGENVDVPAGDIGVGAREIGYLFGAYKKYRNSYDAGVLTGKGLEYGGSLARKEATGFGLCYFVNKMLDKMTNDSFKGKDVVISGSGNVALYACKKVYELGGKVIAMSDSNGYIYNPKGINFDLMRELKEDKRARISEYAKQDKDAKYFEGSKGIWNIKCDIALPCATQNEIDLDIAKELVKNGVKAIGEGANMPCTMDATNYFIANKILYAPAKAANAGGVMVSGLEMAQNASRLSWSFAEVDNYLHKQMENICDKVFDIAKDYNDPFNSVKGANIAGFEKVAKAMIAQGII